ncbi:uncharacterized protein METZ01_LOCUS367633, partial [marine metagenome]
MAAAAALPSITASPNRCVGGNVERAKIE